MTKPERFSSFVLRHCFVIRLPAVASAKEDHAVSPVPQSLLWLTGSGDLEVAPPSYSRGVPRLIRLLAVASAKEDHSDFVIGAILSPPK